MYKRSNQPKPSLMKYPTLYELLKDFTAIKGDKITHTRIGDKRLNVYGGSYSIPEDKEITDEFYHHYFHHVFVSKKQEYLTEVQIDCPPVLVDLDFRYSPEIEDRQHNTEHIHKLVCLYLKTIGELFHVEESQVKVFIMEKPDVNMLEDKTKDGIHLIIGYCLTHQQQTLIRKHVLKTIGDVLGDLPLINSFEDVLDEGISKGHTNWNVFGSRKPAHTAYALTHVYNATYNEEGFELDELNVSTLYDGSDANNKKLKKYMRMCSAKYSGFDKLQITPAYKQELENMTLKKQKDKPLKASHTQQDRQDENAGLPFDKQTEKFWDYAELLKDEEMTSYEGWFRFTCLHKNILGDSDYERFDEFCSKYSGYDDEKNQTTYESLERRETPTWGTLYYLASQNKDKKQEKYEIDSKWDKETEFNRFKFFAMLPHEGDYEDISNIDEIKQDIKHKLTKSKKYFEKYFSKLLYPSRVIAETEGHDEIISWVDFKTNNENLECVVSVKEDKKTKELTFKTSPFVDWWKKQVAIKTASRIDFLPPPLVCPSQTHNTFKGFRIWDVVPDGEKHDFSILTERLKLLCENDDTNYNYMIHYLAHLVQKPAERPNVSIVFKSKQGVGKNLFFENFVSRIMGDEYLLSTANIDNVLGRFNMNVNRLMVLMDEAHGKDTFSNNDKIKSLITAEQLNYEKKGIDGIKIRNCGRYIMFSNNETPIKIEPSDRRFVVFECSNKNRNNREYFAKVYNAFLDDQVIRAFYDFLMSKDLTLFDLVTNRPTTKIYKDIQESSLPHIVRFMIDKYYEIPENELNSYEVKASTFFKQYTEWCEKNHIKDTFTNTVFGRKIKGYSGVDTRRTRSGVVYSIQYNELKRCFEEDNMWENIVMDL